MANIIKSNLNKYIYISEDELIKISNNLKCGDVIYNISYDDSIKITNILTKKYGKILCTYDINNFIFINIEKHI